MRNNDNVNSFSDLGEHSFQTFPHQVIRNEDFDNNLYREEAEFLNMGYTRKVFYEDGIGNRYYLELVPYRHPTGAANLTLGSKAVTAGVATFTPSVEGLFLAETGVLVPTAGAPQPVVDIAGLLFADYYYHFTDNMSGLLHFAVETLTEGDFCWLIRNGDWAVDWSGAVNSGDIGISSTTVAGEVEAAAARSTASVAAFADYVEQNTVGQPKLYGLCEAQETLAGAGLGAARIMLGEWRYAR